MSKQGHVCRLELPCVCDDSVVWLSSGLLGHPAKYVANVRMVHAFTCTGLTETQYHSFGEAAGIGSVMDKTIDTIYKDQCFGYFKIVKGLAQKSMADARQEVQATNNYITNGDCIITDARHDSSRAAMHSTVSAISMSKKKIIGVCNWSRTNERSAPSREVPMTKELMTILTENQGHNVTEVAYDCVVALKNWFQSRGIRNSLDTWHGTKGVAKEMKKICSGPQRDEGVKWFTDLSDKAKPTKTHFYWAMRNNDGTEEGFQKYLLNIVDHYQCRDTFYIEPFHVVILIYAAKRIHFGDDTDTYEMRVHLAVLDWKQKNTKRTPYICEVIYKAVEGEAKGFADIRNITVVRNDSDTYKVKVYNVESSLDLFPLIPDSVTCNPGEQMPTGDMWTPWCDNQQKLEEGHYIRITLSKRSEDDHVYQLFQSGLIVYKTVNMDYSLCSHIQGDYNIKRGEYKLIITGSTVEDVKFTFDRY